MVGYVGVGESENLELVRMFEYITTHHSLSSRGIVVLEYVSVLSINICSAQKQREARVL
jgi:hypothetical protein